MGADAYADRRQDVAPLSILVQHQGDTRAAVRVVFDRDDATGNADLVALPIDDPIHALVAAATVAGGNAAVVISTSRLLERLGERTLGFGLGDLFEGRHGHAAATWRSWFVGLYGHQTPSKRSSR